MKQLFKTMTWVFCLISMLSCDAKVKTTSKEIAFNTKVKPAKKQFIKVALLLDTSNSMDGLIDQAKAQLWDIVNELSYARCAEQKPNLLIALYEYGNDGLNSEEGFIRQVLSFSNDLDVISEKLFSLTTNGGNEYCGQVIQTSLNQLEWGDDPDDLKLVFIAGNEPFSQGKVNYQDAAKQAHKNDISVNTIFCGDYNQGIATYWKDGADLSHGNYMAINHNHATTYVATPYDDQILQLNHKLNNTYIAYGETGKQKMALQSEQDEKAYGYSQENAVSRTVSKSSHLYKNSRWDLVDAEKEGTVQLDQLKKEALPEALRKMSASELEAYIKHKREERDKVQKDIQKLNEQRRQFISSQQKSNDNGLESAMIKAIKTQAKAKKYTWQ
ncbi:MAG: VWA domain-containing protein [Algicola sp.]|nr:VWA domain-containing protein [Algicola sp.]